MSAILSLSTNQLLSLWEELTMAYHGKHGFGTDTAEIYIYRCMEYSPTVAAFRGRELAAGSGMEQSALADVALANRALYEAVKLFEERYEAVVEMIGWVGGLERLISNPEDPIQHRVHLRVKPRKDA